MQAKVSSGSHMKKCSLLQITCAPENQTDQSVWCHGTGRTEVGQVEQLGDYLPGGVGNLMGYYELLFTLLKPYVIKPYDHKAVGKMLKVKEHFECVMLK